MKGDLRGKSSFGWNRRGREGRCIRKGKEREAL